MAFPQVLGTSKGVNGSNVTSHPVVLPTSISAGELIVVCIGFDGSVATEVTTPSYTWFGGYVRNVAAGTPTAAIFWKRAVGTEGGTTITITSTAAEQSSYVCLRFSVDSLILPVGGARFLVGNSTNSTFNTVGSNGLTAQDYTHFAFRSGDGSVQPTAPSTNYTLVDSQAGGGTGASVYVQDREQNSSATAVGALTVATEQWATMAFSVYFPANPIEIEFAGFCFRGQTNTNFQAFSFKSNGLLLKELQVEMQITSGTGSGRFDLYAHTGTFGTTGVPTGTALASTNVKTIANGQHWTSFEFATPYQTTNGTAYFLHWVSVSGGGPLGTYSTPKSAGWGDPIGNLATFSGGVWTANTTSDFPPFALFSTTVSASTITESIGATDTTDETAILVRSISESVSATDTTDETLQTTASISESISATESQASGGATISDSVTESISATESQNRTAIYSSSASESIGATDSTDETATLVRSISESVSATDTTDETAVLVRSISESISATENQDKSVIFSVSLSESVSVTESQSGGVQYILSLSESISATDTQDSSYALLVSVSESISATDSQNRTFTTTASLSESVTATDSQNRTAVTNVSLTESIGATESQNRTATLVRSLSESVSITESQSGFYQISLSASESVLVSELQTASVSTTGQYLSTAKVIISLTQGSVSSSLNSGSIDRQIIAPSIELKVNKGKAVQEINQPTIQTRIGL